MGISTTSAVRKNAALTAPAAASAEQATGAVAQANAAAVTQAGGDPAASGASSAAATPATTEASKSSGGLFGFVSDVFVGGGEAAWDMVKGVGTMIAHPIKTIEGLGYAVTHPAALVHAFVDPYAQAIAEGRPGLALGRGIVEIGSFFIPMGGFGGASADGVASAGKAAEAAGDAGKAAEVAGDAGKAAEVTGDAGKAAGVAGDAGKAAEVAGGAGKAAEVAGDAGKAANFAARLAEQPILTKAAQAAMQEAGISADVGKAALTAAHSSYWESRAAGLSAKAAEAAAASKAAGIMGVAEDSEVAAKIVSGARLAGAAVDTGEWIARTNFVERPLVAGAKIVGSTIDSGIVATAKAGQAVADAASATVAKVGAALSDLGDITVGQIVTAPVTLAVDAGKAVAVGVTKVADELGSVTLGDIVEAPVRAVQAGARAVAAGAEAVGGMTIGDILSSAVRLPGTIAKAALANPASLVKPLALAGLANSLGQGALAGIAPAPVGTSNSNQTSGAPSDQQVQQIAQQYGLEPTAQNVANFLSEVQSYAKNAIGPDSGTSDQVKQLQTVLRALGYDVDPSGTFDDKTAAAVVDFKKENGIHQSYNMADGSPAVNEYVDSATAQAMVAAVKAGWTAGPSSSGSSSSTSAGSAPAASGSTSTNSATSSTQSTAGSTPAASGSSSTDSASGSAPAPTTSTPATPSTQSTAGSTPAASASTATPSASGSAPAPASANPAPAVSSYTVTAADRQGGLWGIAARFLGDAAKWPEIYALNRDIIGPDPNVLHVGEVLKMPADAQNLPGSSSAVSAASTPAQPASTPAQPASAPAQNSSPASPASASSSQMTDAQVSQIAKQYGLAGDRGNVEAFAAEVNGYRNSAIGPDAGTKDDITKLQQVLEQLGYTDVKANGSFDNATANAVIDFKQKHGIHQTYKLANGNWAINEYVDENTANAMAVAVSGGTNGN